jgi:mannan endo-1,4-beta-mannosidase
MKKWLCVLVLMGVVFSVNAQIDENPVDPDANKETRELYRYLRNEIWGKKVLSGCQAEWNYNINDAERIKEACGKYPKVNVFDFQHFEQSWINYRTTTAKQWHDAGGIVSFMWHINMPLNAFAEQKSDWEGFYNNGEKPCHILPSRCATEGTLENKIFRRKLEGVASLLRYYQSQGIPIIWRPLHEASGRWFWWGSEDGAAYKKLYIYMFEYFREAGIHNLLWVWTSQLDDEDWYPGDEYVDIVARDGYPQNNTTHMSQAADFLKLRQAHPNKMIALPECNSVPSWENMVQDGALWLIVAPWCGGGAFDHGNTDDFWRQFLGNENVITRE